MPAEIWRTNEHRFTKVFVKEKEVENVMIDPNSEIADVNIEDNFFPRTERSSKFDDFKKKNN